jgi:hypothetical protein
MESLLSLIHELIQNYPWEIFLLAYFLPTIISLINPMSMKLKIFFLNLIGGWTVVYWFVVFFLAFASTKSPTPKNKQGPDLRQRSFNQVRTKAAPSQIMFSRESTYPRPRPKGFVMTRYVEPTVLWWRHLP